MPDYRTVPLEFAQGILSLRNSLAQEKARIQELKRASMAQEAIEMARIRTQQMGQMLQAEQGQGQLQLGQAELGLQEKALEAKTQFQLEQLKEEREARLNNILAKVGKEPVYFPAWAKLPSNLQGPMLKDEATGEEKPAYTVAVEPDESGGHMIIPLTDATLSAKYAEIRAERERVQQSSLLSSARRKTELLRQAKFLEEVEEMSRGMNPVEASKAITHFNEFMKQAQEMAIGSRKTKEFLKDPFSVIPEGMAREVAQGIAKRAEAAVRYQQDPTEKPPLSALGLSPIEIYHRTIADELAPLPASKEADTPLGARNFIESEVLIDISKGKDKATWRDWKRGSKAVIRPGQGLGKKRTYFDAAGKPMRVEIYSQEGKLIRTSDNAAQPELQAPSTPASTQAGQPAIMAPKRLSDQETDRLTVLNDKVEAGTATQAERAEWDALLNRAAGF